MVDIILGILIYVVSAVLLSAQIRNRCEAEGHSSLLMFGEIECKVKK